MVYRTKVTTIISNISKQTELTGLSLRSSRASISWYPSARSSSTASSITAAATSFVISRILKIWFCFEKDEISFEPPLINYTEWRKAHLFFYLDIEGKIIPLRTSSSLIYAAKLQFPMIREARKRKMDIKVTFQN
jgi:hypothetical protein